MSLIFYKNFATATDVNADYSAGVGTGTFTCDNSVAVFPPFPDKGKMWYWDADGNAVLVSTSNVPRLNQGYYDETGFHLHPELLMEHGYPNWCKWNSDFTQSVWTKTNVSVGSDSVPTPLGTLSTVTLTATSDNGTVTQVEAPAELGVLIKRKTGTGNVRISGWTENYWSDPLDVSDTEWRWFRTDPPSEPNDHTYGIKIETSGDSVYVCGFSLGYYGWKNGCPGITGANGNSFNYEYLSYPSAGNRSASSEMVFVRYRHAKDYDDYSGSYGYVFDDDGDRRYIVWVGTGTNTYSNYTDSVTSTTTTDDDTTADQVYTAGLICNRGGSPPLQYYLDTTRQAFSATNFTAASFGTKFSVGCRYTDGRNIEGALYSIAIFNSVGTDSQIQAIVADLETYHDTNVADETVDDIVVSEVSQTFVDSIEVSLSCATSGSEIRYTTDGSEPTIDSDLYSSPLTFTHITTLRAIAFKSFFAGQYVIQSSNAIEETYTRLAATYYVKNGGGDDLDGKSDNNAWATIDRVNSDTFSPGDIILFKRGDSWRESLIIDSGSASGDVSYGSYGTGSKPILYGSRNKSSSDVWEDLGGNIWKCSDTETTGGERFSNPSFDTNTTGWIMYANVAGGAAATGARTIVPEEYDTAPGGYKLVCTTNGAIESDLQFYNGTVGAVGSIEKYTLYRLTFRAKCTSEFTMGPTNGIRLIKMGSPYTEYYSARYGDYLPTITTSWSTFNAYFLSNTDASDARVNFSLGNAIPDGATLCIDTLSLKRCIDHGVLDVDVGNIVFNDEESVGVKKWDETDLEAQGDFWYDETNDLVKMYSTQNPGEYYSNIEFAMRRDIIDGTGSYVSIDGLDLRYGGSHGIGLSGGPSHITVTNCDLRYIGGGDQYGGTSEIRYGNGIEFWCTPSGTNLEIASCAFVYCFDEAMSVQGNAGIIDEVYFHDNEYVNCRTGMTCVLFTSGSISNVRFENNRGSWGNSGWNIEQKTGTVGFLAGFGNGGVSTTNSNISITNNVYQGGDDQCTRQVSIIDGFDNYVIDNNQYYREDGGSVMYWGGTHYSLSTFSLYQQASGNDLASTTSDPLLCSAGPQNTSFGYYQHITLSCADPNAEIRYTIDGTDPTYESSVYTAPFTITGTTIKYRGYWFGGLAAGTIYSTTYNGYPSHPPSGFKYNEYYLYSDKAWEMAPSGVSYHTLASGVCGNAPVVVTSSGYEQGLSDPWARCDGGGKYTKVGYGYFSTLSTGAFDESKNEFCLHPDASGKILFNKILNENVFIEYEAGPTAYYIMNGIDYNPIRNETMGGFVHFSKPGEPTDLHLTASQGSILADGYRGCTLTATLFDSNFDRVPSHGIVFEITNLLPGLTPVSGVYSGEWSELGYILPNKGSVLSVDASGGTIKILETTNTRGEAHVSYKTNEKKTGIAHTKAYYVNASGVYDTANFAQYWLSVGPFVLDLSLLDTLEYLTNDIYTYTPDF